MNLTQLVLEFIAKNPDQKISELVAAFPEHNPHSVKTAVHRMRAEGKLVGVSIPGGYTYRVCNDRQAEQSDCKSGLEMLAKTLEARCLYRRAAAVWQQLCDTNCSVSARDRYIRSKNDCIRKSKINYTGGTCHLAGSLAGGYE